MGLKDVSRLMYFIENELELIDRETESQRTADVIRGVMLSIIDSRLKLDEAQAWEDANDRS